MEILVASFIGALSAAGVYLILRRRSFAVVLGTTLLSYAINVFLFSTGRLIVNAPPLLGGQVAGQQVYTDPLPQALVLTAIVISFGMTAVVVMMALGAFIEGGDDRVDMPASDRLGPSAADAHAEEAAPDRALPSETDRAAKRARQHLLRAPDTDSLRPSAGVPGDDPATRGDAPRPAGRDGAADESKTKGQEGTSA